MSESDPHIMQAPPGRVWRDEGKIENWRPQRQEREQKQGRTADLERTRGPADRALRDEVVAWRQTSIYVGTVSAGSPVEVGLGSPPIGGAMIRRVQMRVRTDFGTDSSTVNLYWRDGTGTEQLIQQQDFSNQLMTAHLPFEIWHSGSGVRIQPQHEVTLQITVGSGEMDDVTVYVDWYVGL